ncbi:hypothetical protein EJ05DRAFT_500613 [Pseudovirgaria hyperparasitica]|uniref:Heterokaryon incompatibility domain-containing protein n=1 Tax=Pseudovirgaria hyperparasitica TaxID=470096 RepID=A0A6A6W6C6_9PEZI|nr:uncharacterized protein EJ05DRAFT_500613 [Pseudovirgaria hyperparasitica]KAF2758095.1 hypothetical protein EJ05DRAFT_500613 [Pseudovirgaria hyperparasitica]
MSRVTPFKHQSRLSDGRIRLLRVKLRPREQNLELTLREYGLHDVEFDALSYVWGDPSNVTAIKCNGCELLIGKNLHEALLEKKKRGSGTLLWADAICINQSDDTEKTTQVRMMWQIFKTASRVIIWLGAGNSRDSIALKLAQRLYLKCDGVKYSFHDSYNMPDLDLKSLGEEDPYKSLPWEALFGILTHEWFTRIWVVQELLVSSRSIIWRGSLDAEARVVLWCSIMIGTHKNLYMCFNNAMNRPKESALLSRCIASGYLQTENQGIMPIYDVLSRYPGMKATDPRDRFFALSGISTGLEPEFVDYHKTFAGIASLVGKMTLLGFPNYRRDSRGNEFIGIPKAFLPHRWPIDWLTFNANPKNEELGIPSWIPDLISAHSSGLLMSGFYNTKYLTGYRDVPVPEVSDEIVLSLRDRGHLFEGPVPERIDIKGAFFDTIGKIGPRRPHMPGPEALDTSGQDKNIDLREAFQQIVPYELAMVEWLSALRRLADPFLDPLASIMDDSSFESFWRTLVYNRDSTFDPDDPCKPADNSLGVSFGYWFLLKKLFMTGLQHTNEIILWYMGYCILTRGAAPFELAESKVRDARDFFVSSARRIGWVPFRARAGDHICVLKGMRIPVVLRAHGGAWKFIGACYVHGLMDGEVWDLPGLDWHFISFV